MIQRIESAYATFAGDKKLSGRDMAVLIALAYSENGKTGLCYPSHDRLSEMTHYSVRSIDRGCAALKRHKVIEWEREKNNRFKLLFGFNHEVSRYSSSVKDAVYKVPECRSEDAKLAGLNTPSWRTNTEQNTERTTTTYTPVVVVQEDVKKVIAAAAKATGAKASSFANLGITADTASFALEAIEAFREKLKNNPNAIKTSPVGYLRTMISAALQNGGMKTLVGDVAAPDSKNTAQALRKRNEELVANHWKEDGVRAGLNQISPEERAGLWRGYCRAVMGRSDLVADFVPLFWADWFHDHPRKLSPTDALAKEFAAYCKQFAAEHCPY